MFRIHAYLPKDRSRQGRLHLFGDDGTAVAMNIVCYGKADNARAAQAGNPDRDPTRPYGDTPAGAYEPARVMKLDPPDPRLGAFFLPLEGLEGDALKATSLNGRTGLGIHAGRGDERLVATYGCLRLRDSDMASLAELVGTMPVQVTIEDI